MGGSREWCDENTDVSVFLTCVHMKREGTAC